MIIYGKTLPEIFKLLPIPYKIVVIAGTAFFLFALPYSLHFFFTAGRTTTQVEPVQFTTLDANLGVLDPAMADNGQDILMAHTVLKTVMFNNAKQWAPEVVLERSTKGCRAWSQVANAGFPARQEEVMGPDGLTPLDAGVWASETPALVYDPDDKGHEWKSFAYKYYWTGSEGIARLYSFIATRSSPDVQNGWSPEEWLFSASAANPPEPYSKLVRYHLNDFNPELRGLYFYSRPSVIYAGGTLFMSLSAFTADRRTPNRVILLASTDHGKSWQYLGTPLRESDVATMGAYTTLGGATLLQKDGKILFSAVLGDAHTEGLGVFLMEFEDITKGLLKRDAKTGAPAIAKYYPRNSVSESHTGGGYAAYDALCPQGLFVSEFSEIRKSFQIFKSFKSPDVP